ncbi:MULTISPECIES: hypothetical protein [unclassified Halomonas]|uniref:hypothetical protein n=1 Tax=unclassified Halomonas TaxID=2609666 RepID=UPI000551F2CF|nr:MULTISPECIES: hypothetical protein [unclassified Halomonas]
MNNTSMLFISVFTSMAGSSVAAALITIYFSKKRDKHVLSLQLIDYFLDNYHDVGEANYILTLDSYKIEEKENYIRKHGDWFNLIAMLKKNDSIEWKILQDMGLEKTMEDFHDRVASKKASGVKVLENAWQWWPDLHRLF